MHTVTRATLFLILLAHVDVNEVSAEPGVSLTQEIESARMPNMATSDMAVGRPFGFSAYRKAVSSRLLQHGSWKLDGPPLACAVALTISDSGEIEGLRVSETSGNESFDRQILSLFEKAKPLPAPPRELRGRLNPVVLYFDSRGPVADAIPGDDGAERALKRSIGTELLQKPKLFGKVADRVRYIQEIQSKVRELWKSKQSAETKICKIVASISEKGELSSARVAVSSGDKGFDELALSVLMKAGPFSPPPVSVRNDVREIVFTFDSRSS